MAAIGSVGTILGVLSIYWLMGGIGALVGAGVLAVLFALFLIGRAVDPHRNAPPMAYSRQLPVEGWDPAMTRYDEYNRPYLVDENENRVE